MEIQFNDTVVDMYLKTVNDNDIIEETKKTTDLFNDSLEAYLLKQKRKCSISQVVRQRLAHHIAAMFLSLYKIIKFYNIENDVINCIKTQEKQMNNIDKSKSPLEDL